MDRIRIWLANRLAEAALAVMPQRDKNAMGRIVRGQYLRAQRSPSDASEGVT